jgi:hypothetical protein
MICRIINFVLFVCIIIFSNFIHAQEAEKLFKEDYSKIGFVIQHATLKGSYVSDNSSPTINFVNTFSPQFGFVYNFAQYKNFNFKTGIVAKLFRPSFDIIISNEDLNAGYDYSTELTQFDLSNQYVLSQLIKAEYFYPLSKRLNLVFGVGLSLDIRTGGGNDMLFVGVNDFNTNEYKRILIIDSNEQQITGSNDISLGLNYKAKFGLIQFEFFNNSQLLSYPKTGVYQFVNIKNNQTKTGVYNVKGNYSGFSLIFSPKKGLLVKNIKD